LTTSNAEIAEIAEFQSDSTGVAKRRSRLDRAETRTWSTVTGSCFCPSPTATRGLLRRPPSNRLC